MIFRSRHGPVQRLGSRTAAADEPTLSYGSAVKLFDAPMPSGYTNDSDLWQVTPDGKRFLFLRWPARSRPRRSR